MQNAYQNAHQMCIQINEVHRNLLSIIGRLQNRTFKAAKLQNTYRVERVTFVQPSKRNRELQKKIARAPWWASWAQLCQQPERMFFFKAE